MELEYKIIYKIDGDIPISPAWIRDNLETLIKLLQYRIDKKNLLGVHKLSVQAPEGWARPIKNQGSSDQA